VRLFRLRGDPSRIWIGGGTGSGKSTAARALAVKHGLRRFPIDAFWYAYDARWAHPRKSPDEQWLDTPPEVQAAEFEETSRRMMGFALDDLAVLPDVPTVVEGPQILPDLVPSGEQAVSPEAPQRDGGYPFACECGRRGCDELVQLTIEEFDSAPQVLVHV
jgi:hypothetical protein